MNYKNKLMGLSLILLAAFSACTDDVENGGRDSGTDDHRITFAVGTESPDARTRADGSLPDAAGSYETNSVEMQGKLDVTRNFAASLFRNIKYFTLRKLYLCRKWMQKRLQKTTTTGITLPNFDFLA